MKSDGKQLTLKTDYAGDVNLQWSAVKEVTTDKPHLRRYTGQENDQRQSDHRGRCAGDYSERRGAGSRSAQRRDPCCATPMSRRLSTRASIPDCSKTGTAAPMSDLHWRAAIPKPPIFPWLSTRCAPRTTDKLSAYVASIYASNNAAGSSGVTANDIRGGARFDRNIVPKIFAFGSGDFEYNETQDLDLRSIWAGGLGYHAIKSDSTVLDLLAGGDYTRENYSTGVLRNTGGIVVGQTLFHKLGKSTVVNEQIFFYPDLTESGQYRIAFDLGTVTKIKSWLGWQTAVSDRYLSNPIPGTKSNDIILTTGINVSFKH